MLTHLPTHVLPFRVDDPALTEKGQQQAEGISKFYSSILKNVMNQNKQVRLFSSGFLRTMQTAEPLCKALDIPVEVWSGCDLMIVLLCDVLCCIVIRCAWRFTLSCFNA
jgi:hypothetical protein